VLRFESEFLDYLRRNESGILEGIRESRTFTDDTESSLDKAFEKFAGQFETSEGGSIKPGREEHEALEDEDVEQEQIVKQKRG
jgi:F-type H+-transporting ATPase subunit alpha